MKQLSYKGGGVKGSLGTEVGGEGFEVGDRLQTNPEQEYFIFCRIFFNLGGAINKNIFTSFHIQDFYKMQRTWANKKDELLNMNILSYLESILTQ